MSQHPKRPLAEAEAVSASMLALLRPYSKTITVAGSCRRQRPEVGDIEYVVVPRQGLLEYVDRMTFQGESLFATDQPFRKAEKENGRPKSWGPKHRSIDFLGWTHDVYVVSKEAFGRQLAIRTGPAEFSKRLVILENDRGFGREDGALLDRFGVIATPTEQSYFATIGLAYSEPRERGQPFTERESRR